MIQEDREEGMSEQMIQQEYYCDFEGAIEGAYYADQLSLARKNGRIRLVPYDPDFLVDTAWDLGVDDATAIGFSQTIYDQCRWIDYYEHSGVGLEHYVKVLREQEYVYGRHYAPHDMKVKEFGSGKTRVEMASTLGLRFDVVPKLGIADGIQAT